MTRFVVRTTSRFERLLRRLARGHPELVDAYADVLTILGADPYNHSRRHQILKLEGIPQGAGQYRLRFGRWRFRYDIYRQEVILQYCGLRREDTYR